MDILQYYDQNHNKKRGIINYKDLKIVSTLQTGEKELSFSLPHKQADFLVNEGYIRTKDNEYVVKNISSTNEYDFITCNLNLEELEGNFFDGFDSSENTIDKCIQLLIAGTGWTCEVIESITKRRTIRKTGTLLEILTQIKNTYLVEIEFDTLNKVIKVYNEIGSDKGAYMMEDVNLYEIQVDSDSYDFATKIVAYGAVNEETQRPISVTVTNNEYSNKVISLMWKDERYTILEHLKEDAEEKLKEICKPRKAYCVYIYDLAKMSPKYHLLSYSLGDTITLISKDLGVKEKQRIVKITEYPNNPENNVCEISNRIYTVDDILQSQIDTETTINNITSTNDKISPLAMDEGVTKLIKVDIQQLNAVSAKIGELIANKIKADVADIDEGIIGHLLAQKIEAQDLVASNIKFDIAEGGTLSVKDLLTKFLSAGSTETLHLTAGNVVIDDAVIKSAMIDSVSADKIKAGTLDANNVTLLAEKEGYKLVQTGRLFQWFKNINGTYVLIAQLGFDASNKFTFAIKDESGTYTVYDEKGITEHAVPDQLIVDDMVSDSANINGKKLNIDSLITEINDDNTKTIKGSKILIDSTGQTVDISFDTLSETVNDIGESTKTIQTDFKIEQGKVEQLIKDTNIISGETSELKDSYNEIKSTVDGTVQTVSSIETKVNNINATNLFRAGGGKYLSVDASIWTKTSFTTNDDFTLDGDANNKWYRLFNTNSSAASNSGSIHVTNKTLIKAPSDKKISVSFRYYCNDSNGKLDGIKHIRMYILQEHNNSNSFFNSYEYVDLDKTTVTKLYKGTFTLNSSCTRFMIRFDLANNDIASGVTTAFWFKDITVVNGVIPANEWSPSFEDLQGDIDILDSSYESVRTSYNEIKTTVDGTVQTVSSIETKVNKNAGDIQTASNKINEIKTTVDGTVQTVSSVENKINNLNTPNLFKAGGGKYLSVDGSIWSKTEFKSGDTFTLYGSDTNKFYRIYNASDNNYIYVTNNTPIKAPDNKKISISFWYYCNNAVNTLVGIKNIRLYILQELNESGNFYNAYKMAELNKTLTAQQYKGTFELDENCTRYKIRFDLGNGTLSNGAKTQFVFKDVAVVDGLVPSNEWSPSFEDVQSDIDVVGSRVSSCEVKTTDEYFSVQVQKNQNRKFAVRYIRDYCNGSSADSGYCNWTEIKAINTSGVNVALNKTPTSNISITNASVITNGIYENKSQFAAGKASNNTIPYVKIDLGRIYNDIDEIKVWHYYSDARRYHKTKTEISADGSNWITLFDSDVSGEYIESQYGHSIKVNGDSFNSSQVVINELGLHVYNGAIDISNNAGSKVFEADADGNLKITGVAEQRDKNTNYLATSLDNNGLGVYNYTENGDLTGGIVSVRDRYGGRSAFVFCDESNHLDLGYRTGGTENDFGTGTFVSCLSVLNKGGENDPKITIAAPTSYEHVEHHKNGAIYMYDDKRTYFMDGTKMNDDKIRVVRTMADSNSLAYVMNGFYSRIKFQVKKDGVVSNQMILGTDKVYVTSDFSVTGTKNRLVHTERYGYVNQSAYETCSPYFGDIMRATINEDGYCAVIIEDVFKETINTKYQYEVCILGVYGNLKMTDEELKNLWCRCIDQQEDHFLLRGTPGAQVGIEVKALQRGYEGERLSQSTDIVDNERVDLIEKPSTNEEEIEIPVIDDTESESILENELKLEESINNNDSDNKNNNDSDIIIQEDNSQYIKEESETKDPENNTSIDNLFFDLCNE